MSLFYLKRDGRPIYGPDSHDRCWTRLHRLSSGASVDWLLAHEGYSIEPAPAGAPIALVWYPNLERGYLLRFPLAELGNALAVCGWEISHKLPRTPEVLAAHEGYEEGPGLPLPEDTAAWFAAHAEPYAEGVSR